MRKAIRAFIIVAAYLLLPASSFAQCSVCFNAATNYTVGANPYSVVSADFNADGKVDLAVANWSSGSVSILLGTGTGTFGAATNFAVGVNPRSITTADFNADGKPDLATGNDGSNNVSVLLGTGSGAFGAATNFSVSASPEAIVTADFNADGKADLATANYGSLNVSVLLGTGTGSFSAATNYATGASSFPSGICKADFNADGKMDLATVSSSGTNVSRLTGNGTGGFGAPAAYTFTSGYSYSICTADFNLDGKADVALANAGTNNASRLLGNGAGAFGAASNFAAGSFSYCVTSADFNVDGKPDLAVANYSSNNVSVLMGMGTGSFCAAVSFGAASSPTSICSADFNGDGAPDLAVTNNNSNNVSVLLNCTMIVLPIKLISFTGNQTGASVSFDWTTATELNNDYFTIERSMDGNNYKEIARIEGAGNSSQAIHYSAQDENPFEGINYYRLKQTDFNGQFEYFNILAIPVSNLHGFTIFPNPASGIFSVISPAEVNSIEVYNVFGEKVFSGWTPSSQSTIDLTGQPPGIYFITVKTGKESFTQKVSIQK